MATGSKLRKFEILTYGTEICRRTDRQTDRQTRLYTRF